MVRVQIGNYPANTRVAIAFDGTRKLTLTTDRSGAARGELTILATVAGSHEITAKGGGRSAARPFTVRPLLTVSTTSIVAGRTLTVTLAGFDAGKTVKIRLYDVGSTTRYSLLGELRTDSTGGATKSLTVPRTTKGGSHKLLAYQTSSRNDDANLRVTALTPTPTRTATPRPSACANARTWMRTTLTRDDLVIDSINLAFALYRQGRLSVQNADTIANNIRYWARQQANSRPPGAATAMNDHLVSAYSSFAYAAGKLAVSVRLYLAGDSFGARIQEVWARQGLRDGDNSEEQAANLLPGFSNRCEL